MDEPDFEEEEEYWDGNGNGSGNGSGEEDCEGVGGIGDLIADEDPDAADAHSDSHNIEQTLPPSSIYSSEGGEYLVLSTSLHEAYKF